MSDFISMIWSFLGSGWGVAAFTAKHPAWALIIGLVVAVLIFALGKKLLTLPLKLAWKGAKLLAHKAPGAIASGWRRMPGAKTRVKKWAIGVKADKKKFAIVGGVIALLIIGVLYWSLSSGTKPKAIVPRGGVVEKTADAIKGAAKEIFKEETPAEKVKREERSATFQAEAQKGAQDFVKGVKTGSFGKAAGNGFRAGYSTTKEGVKRALESELTSEEAEKKVKEKQKKQAEVLAAKTAIDEAFNELKGE